MTIMIDQRLSRLAKALEQLPEAAQADVLAEIEAHVASLTEGRMTDAQRAIVMERLSAPRVCADRQEVEALFKAMKSGE